MMSVMSRVSPPTGIRWGLSRLVAGPGPPRRGRGLAGPGPARAPAVGEDPQRAPLVRLPPPILGEPSEAVAVADHLPAVPDRGLAEAADCRVESRAVPTRGEDSDFRDAGHARFSSVRSGRDRPHA